jgi:hypothetical protein
MRSTIPARIARRSVPSSSGNASRTQAATEIVRLEYERERLTLAVTQYRSKLAASVETLKTVEHRIRWLMERNEIST